ncbi:MAG: hypothetical protein R3B45_16815 [Bdellovibrionota bacterium]
MLNRIIVFAVVSMLALVDFAAEAGACFDFSNSLSYKKFQDSLKTGKKPLDQVLELLFLNGKQDRNNPNFDILWESEQLNSFIENRNLRRSDLNTLPEKVKIVADYVESYLLKYRSEELLISLRDSAWRKILNIHGFQPRVNETARQGLERLSYENKKRILQQSEYISTPSMLKAEKLVNSLELFLAHNSHIMKEAPGYPIIAPKLIEEMGLPNFSATSKPFNKFIGSTDHVYFFIGIKKKEASATVKSEYGDFGVVVDHDYAFKQAWVSPFVMYVDELIEATKQIAPNISQNLFDKKVTVISGFQTMKPEGNIVEDKPEILAAMGQLHKLDFTLSDFENIIKTQLLIKLTEIQRQSPEEFDALLASLENSLGKSPRVDRVPVISELVFKPLNIPLKYEGRIPVAVPDNQLIHFKNTD